MVALVLTKDVDGNLQMKQVGIQPRLMQLNLVWMQLLISNKSCMIRKNSHVVIL